MVNNAFTDIILLKGSFACPIYINQFLGIYLLQPIHIDIYKECDNHYHFCSYTQTCQKLWVAVFHGR